jgi:hypothetical protein
MAELARQAHQEASGNLTAQEDAERLLKAASAAEKDAARAERQKAHATGGERAVGLRSVWIAELTDAREALRHYRERAPLLLKEWLLEQARADVRAGIRSIPGFAITEERKVV